MTMPNTPEGRVKNAAKKFLQAIGVWYYMPMSNGMGRVGAPDFLCCIRGRFLAIETKAPGKRGNTTNNQQREIGGIQDADGMAIVIDDLQQLKDYLRENGMA
jgi:hypothetical protein